MFDTNKVAANIKAARTKMNMTQLNLADEMGVSYQAVSNWERGNSMPDISKLPELCKILDISFEELVGERNEKTKIAEKLIQDENAEVTLEEMAQIGELVKPDKMEQKVNEAIEKEEHISFSTLVSLAPFMDRETLGKIAEENADVDLRKLCALAPFLTCETLDHIVEKSMQNESVEMNHIVALAPFLSRETIQKVAEYFSAHGQAKKLMALAPFMNTKMISEKVRAMNLDTNKKLEHQDYMDEDDVAKLAMKALEQGKM